MISKCGKGEVIVENLIKKCFICGQINCDGIIINGEMICKQCEQKIVNTKVEDSDYDELKDSIKIILFDECEK